MSSDPGGSTSEADLEQIEEDIRLCQQFLSSNKGPVHGSALPPSNLPCLTTALLPAHWAQPEGPS